jgi:hypothetical protein
LLNEDSYRPQTNSLLSQQITTEFHIITPFGKQDTRVRQVKPWVPIEDSAELDDLNSPRNPDTKFGPPALALEGGATVLDGMKFRHVTFIGVEVHYHGGQVKLSDVKFIGCTFVMDNTANSRELAISILSGPAVDLSVHA